MHRPSAASFRARFRFRRLGRVLAIAAQLIVLVAPLAEAREERALGAHVEAPRTTGHPGHRPDACPACILLSVHSCPAERPQLEAVIRQQAVAAPAVPAHATGTARTASNSSRAPPLC